MLMELPRRQTWVSSSYHADGIEADGHGPGTPDPETHSPLPTVKVKRLNVSSIPFGNIGFVPAIRNIAWEVIIVTVGNEVMYVTSPVTVVVNSSIATVAIRRHGDFLHR